MQSKVPAIDICSRLKIEPLSYTLSKFNVWVCPTYLLEPRLQNYGVKIPKWDTKSQIGVIMGFINIR